MPKSPKQSVLEELIVFTFYKQIRYVRNEIIKKLRGKWVNCFIPLERNFVNFKEFQIFVTSMTLAHGF